MEDSLFKINFKYYYKFIAILIVFVVLVNILFNKYIPILSFTNLFSLLVPNWIFVALFYKKQIVFSKNVFESFMKKSYPEVLEKFYLEYKSDTNPDSKPIMVLLGDRVLLKDKSIESFRNETNKLTLLFVATSALTILIFLISTVFIVRFNLVSIFGINIQPSL
jgi:hypothetical protein